MWPGEASPFCGDPERDFFSSFSSDRLLSRECSLLCDRDFDRESRRDPVKSGIIKKFKEIQISLKTYQNDFWNVNHVFQSDCDCVHHDRVNEIWTLIRHDSLTCCVNETFPCQFHRETWNDCGSLSDFWMNDENLQEF